MNKINSKVMRINALSMLFFYYIILFLFFGKTAKCQSILLKPHFEEFENYYCYYSIINVDTIKIKFQKTDIIHEFEPDLDSIFQFPKIYYNNKLVFSVKSNNYEVELYSYTNSDCYSYKKADIKIINVNNRYFYVVFIRIDPLDEEFVIFNLQSGEIKRVPFFNKKYFGDLDNDGFFEIGGGKPIEVTYDEIGSKMGNYRITFIIELGSTIYLDSLLTKKFTLENYFEFYGFDDGGGPIPLKE